MTKAQEFIIAALVAGITLALVFFFFGEPIGAAHENWIERSARRCGEGYLLLRSPDDDGSLFCIPYKVPSALKDE